MIIIIITSQKIQSWYLHILLSDENASNSGYRLPKVLRPISYARAKQKGMLFGCFCMILFKFCLETNFWFSVFAFLNWFYIDWTTHA